MGSTRLPNYQAYRAMAQALKEARFVAAEEEEEEAVEAQMSPIDKEAAPIASTLPFRDRHMAIDSHSTPGTLQQLAMSP
uniref:Uncharacterized protein n=1 Tax=Sphaerodactylus townsendi TaxID=933632 RepID=A0ACB8G339_9SAUR